ATPAPKPKPKPAAAPQAQRRPSGVADAIRPGKLRKSERLRSMFEHGMRISRMHPETRLVGLTLLGYANFQTGQIHARWRPTVEDLADATGLTAGRVLVQVEILTSRGWLTEHVLARGPRAGSRALLLCVPALVLEQLRDRAAQAAAEAEAAKTRD
ncbi:hypothetical protein PYK79_57655, partial [Streptomyces sp. ID05-04B]|uniref:hypothetical protein n=1 Tax=Streptomyces sp. ID05-04B TaxID=3028661 RepID=UPI0029C2861E